MLDPQFESRFADLIDTHHVALRAFVRALGVAADYVDDVAQEAFLKAFADFDRFDPQQDFGRWLRGIARNIVRNELRSTARHRRIQHDRIADIMLVHAEDLSDPLAELGDSDRLLAVLRECMGELTERAQAIVQMRYADDLLAPVIAARCGTSSAAIRQALVRSRETLRDCVSGKLTGGGR